MNLKIYLASFAMAAALSAAATPSVIFPNPQEETVGATAFSSSEATYRLTGAETADPQAVAALSAKLALNAAGTIEIIIGENGDAAVSTVSAKIPSNPQGYYLKVEADKVYIAGTDDAGTYYGVQSFLQLTSQPEVPTIEVRDWPTTEVRGVIEGYYGNPWSHEDCIDMCTYFDQNKMNTFIYGPKNDSYHHGSGVFTPYPEDQAENLRQLVQEAAAHKVDIVWAMHPGNNNDGDNLAKAKAKLEAMYELGFRRFAVFFDDITANSVQKQIDFLNYLNAEVVKAKSDIKGLIMCPSEYCISFAGGANTSSTYLNSLGAGLDSDIDIMWTGWQVVDMQLGPSCDWFTNKTGRKPFIWHNYPCSDYGSRPLLMCPYEPADADLYTKISGFTANPMEFYEASKVGLYGMADFAWNPAKYDPWESWEESVQFIMPDNADAFRTFCYSHFNYPAPKTHGGPIIYGETPEFKALIDEKTFNAENAADYAAYFQKQLDAAVELRALTNNRLVVELTEWMENFELQARRGIALTEMQKAISEQNGEAFLSSYTAYADYTKTADALLSRYFDGSLRWMKPFCGSQYVEPFITNTVEYLIEDFKKLGFDYPAGLFPARVLESGAYHIMYNGRYLTNRNGSSNPTWVKDIDNINPNRQVWNIRYVPETGRYSIHSAEDGRYVNELGDFGVNPYSDDWNTYLFTPLGGMWAIQNAGRSGNSFWQISGARVEQGSNTDYNPKNFVFLLVPAGSEIPEAPETVFTEGDYVIKNAQGQYMTRNTDNTLEFKNPSTTGAKIKSTQKWTITVDSESNRMKISQGSRFVNEKPVISTNEYYSSWNSYKLYERNGKWAIQNGGEAGNNFWIITEDGGMTNESRNLADAFEFVIVSLEEEESGITEITTPDSDREIIFDLQGRRVFNPTHGLYIINGQKVLK